MTGAVQAAPIMLQPMWVTLVVQILTLMLAGGISYGMTRAKLSTNEKAIVALQAKMAQIELDMQIWQKQRLATVVTDEDCGKMQGICKDSVCKKIDELSCKFDTFTTASHLNQQSMALVIGAVCSKLDIPLPELK